ncbi:MAG: YgfZ/GcvT domain-containing protein [Myxococcaceae bacterium]
MSALSLSEDARTAYAAARHRVALFPLERDIISVRGPDRVSFVQGMVTQDVAQLSPGNAAYAALLTAKGAMVSDARVHCRTDALLLEVERGRGEAVKQFLEHYLISEDASLEDETTRFRLVRLCGPLAQNVLETAFAMKLPALLLDAGVACPTGETILGQALWTENTWDVLVPEQLAETSEAKLYEAVYSSGGVEGGEEAAEVLRIEAGVPRYGKDMDEKTIPLEAGLTRAIHYKKGCYIGQEVIARATFRGQVNRQLAGFLLGELSPAPGTLLRNPAQPDRKLGVLTSVSHSPRMHQNIALGYVHRDFIGPGTRLTLESGGEVQVAQLPFAPTRAAG